MNPFARTACEKGPTGGASSVLIKASLAIIFSRRQLSGWNHEFRRLAKIILRYIANWQCVRWRQPTGATPVVATLRPLRTHRASLRSIVRLPRRPFPYRVSMYFRTIDYREPTISTIECKSQIGAAEDYSLSA